MQCMHNGTGFAGRGAKIVVLTHRVHLPGPSCNELCLCSNGISSANPQQQQKSDGKALISSDAAVSILFVSCLV